MPGVPSGRGCDGCRRQKKKCDQQKPACSRCSRLQLVCSGAGSQRYTFKQDHRSGSSSSQERLRERQALTEKPQEALIVRTPPSSETASLARAMAWSLNYSDDVTFDIQWTFGDFLSEVPMRIGTNKALDTAAEALVGAHSALVMLRGSGHVITTHCLHKYSRALRAMRICLGDPLKACQTETLCAAIILSICHTLIGSGGSGRQSTHGEGAARILRARAIYRSKDQFERKLIANLQGPVLIESIVNPRVSFSREEWNTFMVDDAGETTILAQLPDLMRRGRACLREGEDKTLVLSESRAVYDTLCASLSTLECHIKPEEQLPSPRHSPSTDIQHRKLAFLQRLYGITASLCIVYICIIRALGGSDAILESQAAHLCEAMLVLAEQASIFRPLGASYISICLIAAWCGSNCETEKRAIYTALEDYMSDLAFTGTTATMPDLEHMRQCLYLAEFTCLD